MAEPERWKKELRNGLLLYHGWVGRVRNIRVTLQPSPDREQLRLQLQAFKVGMKAVGMLFYYGGCSTFTAFVS